MIAAAVFALGHAVQRADPAHRLAAGAQRLACRREPGVGFQGARHSARIGIGVVLGVPVAGVASGATYTTDFGS